MSHPNENPTDLVGKVLKREYEKAKEELEKAFEKYRLQEDVWRNYCRFHGSGL